MARSAWRARARIWSSWSRRRRRRCWRAGSAGRDCGRRGESGAAVVSSPGRAPRPWARSCAGSVPAPPCSSSRRTRSRGPCGVTSIECSTPSRPISSEPWRRPAGSWSQSTSSRRITSPPSPAAASSRFDRSARRTSWSCRTVWRAFRCTSVRIRCRSSISKSSSCSTSATGWAWRDACSERRRTS